MRTKYLNLRIPPTFKRASIFLGVALCLQQAAIAQSMNSLGTLGGADSFARGVSADGRVIVGFSDIANGDRRAFKYTGSTMTSLGTLGGSISYAYGVSSDGRVIIGSSQITGNLNTQAFQYLNGSMISLGSLGGIYSEARGVSADGSVIVGYSRTNLSSVVLEAFRYQSGIMSSLGTLGGTNSYAYAISADGRVIVGESQITGGELRAFSYSDGTMRNLGTLGGSRSAARGVSGDGVIIVGESRIADGNWRAFSYTDGVMTSLGTLGGTNSYAYGVSADGSVIVGYSQIAGNTANHAFKYTGTTMTSLGTLGGTNSSALGVSADGRVIVGQSETATGAIHAFVYGAWANGALVDVQNTYSALAAQGYQLNALLNSQNTALAVNLNTDCVVFGANNVCASLGGRYTQVTNPNTTQTAGTLALAYRFTPQLRAGVFFDQGMANSPPSNYTLKNSQPLMGLFAVYAPSGTHLGLQVKVSAAYSNNGVSITRNTLPYTEAGQGSSQIVAQGAQLETAYGVALNDRWQASPLVGIKATQVSRNGYTETAGATFPITYNTVQQSATTAYAGAKVFGYVGPKVSLGASAGVEQDLTSNMDNYSGSIYYLGAFSQAAPTLQKTRAFASANADYWLLKNQRVSLGVYYNQQTLNTANGVTALLSYTVGI